MALKTPSLKRITPHAPNHIANVASLTSAQNETLFPSTQGAVHIDWISVSRIDSVPANAPVLITLQHPSGSPVYMSCVVNRFKNPPQYPGFILPAGGMVATSNRATAVSIDVYYEEAD